MTRPDDDYRTCSPGCGCDLDINQDPETSGSTFLTESEEDES